MTSTPVTPTAPSLLCLAHVSRQPLKWLWPDRIPLGHLTLLDAAPDCGLSLFTLTLAAKLSRGTLPDGTATQPATILLIAPYETAEDTILPRFEAAGGDLTRLTLYRPTIQETPQTTVRYRSLDFPRDLDQLLTTIAHLDARLVIIDPASSVTGLRHCLPALIELARHTRCAIVLTRSLSRAPADPLHASGPASPLLDAARSRLLLTPDPADQRQHLLLTTKHALSGPASILAYEIIPSASGVPTLHWLAERDRTALERLSTGPLHSLHRQAILRFLQNSSTPCHIKDILAATSYDYEAGRKMLVRMKMAGELVSPASGLYITANHPCLATFIPPDPPPASRIASLLANVPAVPPSSLSVPSTPPPPHSPTTTDPSPPIVPTVPDPPTTDEPPQPTAQSHRPSIASPCETPFNTLVSPSSNSITVPHHHVPTVPDPALLNESPQSLRQSEAP